MNQVTVEQEQKLFTEYGSLLTSARESGVKIVLLPVGSGCGFAIYLEEGGHFICNCDTVKEAKLVVYSIKNYRDSSSDVSFFKKEIEKITKQLVKKEEIVVEKDRKFRDLLSYSHLLNTYFFDIGQLLGILLPEDYEDKEDFSKLAKRVLEDIKAMEK